MSALAARSTLDDPTHRQGDVEDQDLIALVAQGDENAFRKLHERYWNKLFGFTFRIVQRRDMAEEATLDALMAVWRGAAGFRGEARASTWIFGIAYRTALKACKAVRRENLHDEIDEAAHIGGDGTRELEAILQSRTVAAALDRLPAEQRATVQLTYFYGYRLSEIAEITGCPVGTVKARMFHARAKLRTLLEDGA
ncbi:MAG: RNA polymerase sigma factor [Pseudomonadota bacterium]